jgi:6-phosphofructokinase 1
MASKGYCRRVIRHFGSQVHRKHHGARGTLIGTTNRGHFVAKIGAGDRAVVAAEVIEKARKVLNEARVEALIIVGGDGSMTTALQLQEAGINCVGVPKTIDNDLEATAMTFGFDSAVAAVMDALDRLHTTATSHKRAMVVEVMGRHAGWIALHGGIAGGADVILIPEIPFDFDRVADAIRARDTAGDLSSLVVVAEGARPKDGQQVETRNERRRVPPGRNRRHRGARNLQRAPEKKTRTCVLGHLQRGGAPTTLDRILGTRFGVKAVQLINEGHFGSMVSYQNYQFATSLSPMRSIACGWSRRMARWFRLPATSRSVSAIDKISCSGAL